MTYMASCGSSGCASFDHSNAKWFKIEQYGLRTDGTWGMADLYNGKSVTITLPTNIKAGQYLLRHELLALHTAQAVGGAEFFPACAQIAVGGSKIGTPDETVSFPGAYSDRDAGILIDAYDLTGPYQFPGPDVSNLAGKTVPGSGETPVARAVVETASVNGTTSTAVPRQVSRVMRSHA